MAIQEKKPVAQAAILQQSDQPLDLSKPLKAHTSGVTSKPSPGHGAPPNYSKIHPPHGGLDSLSTTTRQLGKKVLQSLVNGLSSSQYMGNSYNFQEPVSIEVSES